MSGTSGESAVASRLARQLHAQGAPYAVVAAAVLACRGRRVLDQRSFAALLGVPVEHVRTLETGHRPPEHAPRRLAELDGDIDWASAGIDRLGDAASRHPAAGRARPRTGARSGANMPP